MCFSSGRAPEPTTPAPAPAAPLPAADPPKIGESRRDENIENFGTDAPDYRVRGATDDEDYRVDRTSGPIRMS